jgi:uncharacterized SAM-binding protein YcdF (DUF218 family)
VWALALVIGLVVATGAGAGRWLVVDAVLDDPDAILVLASHEYERLPRAWQLAVQHPRATIVLSSPAVPTEHNCQACAYRVGWLVGWGIPRARIHVMEAPVRNSYDELVAAAALARDRQWSSVQVVTSPYHTRRVGGLVRAVIGEQDGLRFGVTSGSYGRLAPGTWWSRRYDGRYVLYEAAALVVNGWRYGIWPWQWHLPGR